MGVQTDRYLEALDDIQKAVESREKSWRSGGHPQPGEARPPGAASTIAGADLKAAECSAILVVIENLRYQHAGVPPLTGVNSWGSAGGELPAPAQVEPAATPWITAKELEAWLTKLEARVATLETRGVRLEPRVESLENRATASAKRTTVLEHLVKDRITEQERSKALGAQLLNERVNAALAKPAVTEISGPTPFDVEPLRRLAESCRSVGHVTAQSVEKALREAGVIPQEEVPCG